MFRKILSLAITTLILVAPIVLNNAQAAFAADTMSKIKFKNEAGAEFAIEGNKQHGTFIDGSTITEFAVSADGKVVTIRNTGKTVGYVSISGSNEWKIKDADKKELFALKQEPDGHYKLKDGSDSALYKVKVEAYGLKIKDKNEQALYKVHTSDNKVSLKSADGKVIVETKSTIPPIAVACFGFDAFNKQQKAALAYALTDLR